MQVQVHADDSIQGGESLAQWAQEEINSKLARLKEYVVRVEVFLTGVDALKSTGGPGKRCVLETRATGRPPIAVNAEAEKVKEAFSAAIDKLKRAVETDLGKLKDKNLRESVRGVDDPSAENAATA
ncbi:MULTISPECIES: HPF/RaiA family ribosome-associated protein [Comamonas]|jgi:ribosome-associated translation inhibitor RaiA|uniref:HPF/RaiA family ribosome-associated protein n=1 Tax=Comamonas resistens TaxID=3046670 RepID=A0ABY8SQV7_9BURK|nr:MULTISPECIES: HPF/RaiA family ribosome-associated protein [Comamonas]MDL5037321.1 HPF/RaiA family ribosome-associated protein [Comamonas resistens]MDR0214842.1 HPF/RaiA family ribosome-associated protein [Comamonas sp.]MDR2300202.1 HPF/RaiA family ribosome-associated protein [Comamonas sp.]WHS65457.1 HPF/RaiA family ribosome-associated protein [Comamonas resistens]